jgi:hypothetical protein
MDGFCQRSLVDFENPVGSQSQPAKRIAFCGFTPVNQKLKFLIYPASCQRRGIPAGTGIPHHTYNNTTLLK